MVHAIDFMCGKSGNHRSCSCFEPVTVFMTYLSWLFDGLSELARMLCLPSGQWLCTYKSGHSSMLGPCWGHNEAVLVLSDYESIWGFPVSECLSRRCSQLRGTWNKKCVAKLGFCILVVCLVAMTRCSHKGNIKCLSFQFRPSWRESHGGSSWWHYIYG